jgi:hypothetical protein
MPIFRRTVVLVQHLIPSLSLGDCSVHRLREDESLGDCSVHKLREDSRNLYTEQSPKESDDTRRCTNTTVLLKMGTIVLETCRGM